MSSRRYLRTLRALAECYHAFSRRSGAHVRALGYTPAQFDIIATLGNTEGMSCRELGERTLITKGTLTGVLDRLEAAGIVQRTPRADDARGIHVRLTRKGDAEFRRVFAVHIRHCGKSFAVLSEAEMNRLDELLEKLRGGFGRP